VTTNRLNDLVRFYDHLDALERKLSGKRKLANCTGKLAWPARGVYFFFEEGEERSHSGQGQRVVRVGTHAVSTGSKSTLWNRLSTHRGTAKTAGGNHRGSIFRLLVGTALATRTPELACPMWGQGNSAPKAIRDAEIALEAAVSKYLGNMSLLWLDVDDTPSKTSERGLIERNSIGLLSNFGKSSGERLDPPSKGWLGSLSDREKVRTSGLWNNNHVDEAYDASFLNVLDRLIQR
jgi:hypothetical protein